ncbi:hypothetical protein D3C81_1717660 [compost metagenome]
MPFLMGQLVRTPSRLPVRGLSQLRLLTTATVCPACKPTGVPSDAQAESSKPVAAREESVRMRCMIGLLWWEIPKICFEGNRIRGNSAVG